MLTRFNEEALNTIRSNKIRSYALFKTETGIENYLREIRNIKIRTQLTKFRLSDHHLPIEKGRRKGLDKLIKFCPFCLDKVEDEIHFLIKCPLYVHLRAPFLDLMLADYINVESIPQNDLFTYLMSLSSFEVGNYIYKAFELRNFLVEKPKRVD